MSFRLANPAALLLLVLPIIGWLAVRFNPSLWPELPVLRYSDVRLMDGLPVSWRVRLRALPNILRMVAWVLLVVAMSRPQSGRAQQVVRGRGLDIVLALDISSSMRALDFGDQNRLEAAKGVIADFVEGREFDRVGLVVFAEDAFHHVPPTLDYELLNRLLGDVQIITNYFDDGGGTAIGLGIASAANMLRASDAPSKVVILLTDGRNTAETGVAPLEAARAAATLGIRIYTIGMGRPGRVPFPIDDGAGGTQLVDSDLDEETLQEIAAVSGTLYFRAEDLQGLQRIYEQIDALERADVERQVFIRWNERALPILIAALVFMLLERLLRHTVFERLP